MKGLLIFLAFALALASVSAELFSDFTLKVVFGLGNPFSGTDIFIELPLTREAAIEKGWKLTEGPDLPYPGQELYCPNGASDCDVGVYIDSETGKIFGQQIAYDKKRFQNDIYDWETQGYKTWSVTSEEGVGYEYWYTLIYYADPDDKQLLEDAVVVTGFNGSLDRIPRSEEELKNTVFTKQACLPWMGKPQLDPQLGEQTTSIESQGTLDTSDTRPWNLEIPTIDLCPAVNVYRFINDNGSHYYYNMTKDTPCSAETMYPWFPLMAYGKVIGMGHIVMGQYSAGKSGKNWCEKPAKFAVQTIVPNGPECLYNLADEPGIVTLHTYFTKDPHLLTCLFQ